MAHSTQKPANERDRPAGMPGRRYECAPDLGWRGSIALASATGLVGHVPDQYPKDMKRDSTSVAAIADHVLPALTAW